MQILLYALDSATLMEMATIDDGAVAGWIKASEEHDNTVWVMAGGNASNDLPERTN